MDAFPLQFAAANPHPDWWAGAAGAVAGSVIGAILVGCMPLLWAWRTRRVECLGEIAAMHVEFYLTNVALTELIKPKEQPGIVLAPLYRLPMTFCERALPKLIGDGLLKSDETAALIEYINRVEEINRGLERAGDAAAANQHAQCLMEYQRNRAKTLELMQKPVTNGGKPLFDIARAALFRIQDSKLPRRRYLRLSLSRPFVKILRRPRVSD